MTAQASTSKSSSSSSCVKEDESQCVIKIECAVCLLPAIFPVKLPCEHLFCFLCIKGVATRSLNCPLCRQQIPVDYFEHPDVVDGIRADGVACSVEEVVSTNAVKQTSGENANDMLHYHWYYEGRNGWWQYDSRTAHDLETSFTAGAVRLETLIAGHLYVVDFQHMLQYRRDNTGKRRKIKRDLPSAPKKGVAGLKMPAPGSVAAPVEPNEVNGTENSGESSSCGRGAVSGDDGLSDVFGNLTL